MSWDLMNSSIGWNSLSRAGKLSPERDIFKDLKNPPVRVLPQWVAKCYPTRSRLNTHTLLVGGGILNPDSQTNLHGWEGTQHYCGSFKVVATYSASWVPRLWLSVQRVGLLEDSNAWHAAKGSRRFIEITKTD